MKLFYMMDITSGFEQKQHCNLDLIDHIFLKYIVYTRYKSFLLKYLMLNENSCSNTSHIYMNTLSILTRQFNFIHESFE